MNAHERDQLKIGVCIVRMDIIEATHGVKAGHPVIARLQQICLPTCISKN